MPFCPATASSNPFERSIEAEAPGVPVSSTTFALPPVRFRIQSAAIWPCFGRHYRDVVDARLALGAAIDQENRYALGFGRRDRRRRGFEFARRQRQNVDSLGEEILDVVQLLGGVVVGVGLIELEAARLGFGDDARRFGQAKRVVVADLRLAHRI